MLGGAGCDNDVRVNIEPGFLFELPRHSLKPALLGSLLSVWVLVGLFCYLNSYTQRRYFTIWTAAWLFYALWLTLCINTPARGGGGWNFLKQWCVGASGTFLLWGSMNFLRVEVPQRLLGLFLLFLIPWSYLGSALSEEWVWVELPVFG